VGNSLLFSLILDIVLPVIWIAKSPKCCLILAKNIAFYFIEKQKAIRH